MRRHSVGTHRRPWRSALLFALLTVTALVGLGELAVRAFALGGGSFYQPDPVLGSWHRPNASGSERGDCYAARVAMNAEGMRDVERVRERRADVPRIAILGDSFMEGMQVDIQEIFSQRLEAELEGLLQTPEVEVLNFGVSGYGTVQEYWTYRERVRAFHPDVVVLAFFLGNDVADNSPSLSGDSHRPHFRLAPDGELEAIPFEPYSVSPAVRWLKEHLQLYGWLFKRATRVPALRQVLIHRADVAPPPTSTPPQRPSGATAEVATAVAASQAGTPLEEAWRVSEAVVDRLRNEVLSDGHGFLMVVIPEVSALRAPRPSSGWRSVAAARVERLCARAALECVFLETSFAEACPQGGACVDQFFLECDGHFAPKGHALAAHVVARALASTSLL